MDQDGSYPKKAKSSESEANISPMHEALRGIAAMPIPNDQVAPNSSSPHTSSMGNTQPIIHAPQETTMMPVENYSMMPYQRNVPLAPPRPLLPHTTLTTLPVENNIAFQPNNRELSQNQQEMLSRQDFLGSPIGNYFELSQQMKVLSMEPPSFTSLLQEDPIVVVHAHINTIGGLDEGPIFEMPPCMLPSHPFTPNTIQHQQVQHGMLSHGAPYGVPNSLIPSAGSTHAPRENKTLVGALNETSDSATSHGSMVSHRYACDICNRTFNSHQAYGGHMSSHSKARRKSQLVNFPM
ncbi:hypothetical protein ACQ4PT_023076 [Festuca glaucescens]